MDPGGLALVAFGGAGPLHACALAEALDMPAVVVPPRAGVLSAAGILGAPRQVDLVRSWPAPAETAGLAAAVDELAEAARARLVGTELDVAPPATTAVSVEVALDCRYAGQSHELTVSSIEEFEEEHRRRNGFAMAHVPVEVVALRATAREASPLDIGALAPPARTGRHVGPTVIAEEDCTIWVADGWVAEVHGSGSWVLDPLTTGDDDAGGAADPDLAADRRRRRDGRHAAPGSPFPQHQGTGRLLRRTVHARWGAPGPGRAHPGAPRQHAGIGRRRHRQRAWRSGRATSCCSTTPSPAAPISTT